MDSKMLVGAFAAVFILLAAAVGYSTSYAEGKDRASRDNAAQASTVG